MTHWKRPWCWEGLGAGGEGDDRGWDDCMASLTQWTWVWVDSRSWWWTGRPGVLRFMRSQRVGHDWATEPNWTQKRVRLTARRRLSPSKWLYLCSLGRERGYLEETATARVHIRVHTWRSVGPAQWCDTNPSSHSLASHQGTHSRKKWNQHKSAAPSPLGRSVPQTKGGDCYHT